MSPGKHGDALLYTAAISAFVAGASAMLLYCESQKRRHLRIPSKLLSSPYAKELVLAVKVAIQAGHNIALYSDAKGTEAENQHDLGIQTKGGLETDFCTKVDILNEELVVDAIRDTFPSHQIIGEESTGEDSIPPLTAEPTWVIDPIDGTTNFASGLPITCVSIALCVEKQPVMGVVYAPMTNELYMAVKGCGSYRNGVLLTQRKTVGMAKAIVDFEFGYARDSEAVRKMTSAVKSIMEQGCRATRQLGAGVLDLCYVASGRMDLVYSGVATESWKPWDHAAGMLIATETGCIMEAIDQEPGTDFDIYSKSLICAGNRGLLEECRKILVACMAKSN